MNSAEFEAVFNETIELSRDVLLSKAAEYADDTDRLHNFVVASDLSGTPMREALAGMMIKHTVSLYDMIYSDKTYSKGVWDEKILDHFNYLILLRAVLQETGQVQRDFPTTINP